MITFDDYIDMTQKLIRAKDRIGDLERQLEEVKKLVDGGLCLPDTYSQPCADEFLADLTKILKEDEQ